MCSTPSRDDPFRVRKQSRALAPVYKYINARINAVAKIRDLRWAWSSPESRFYKITLCCEGLSAAMKTTDTGSLTESS